MNLLTGDYSSASSLPMGLMVLSLLLAFGCGLLLSFIYMFTHSGLSYSRSFVNALVVLPVLVALVMMVMANNLVTAFGLMAVFAIVRFRNILRDTLDTTHILCGIVVGMACGTQKLTTALLGCGVATVIFLFLWWTSYGARRRYDLILNLHWASPETELSGLERVLRRHGTGVVLASQRQTAAPGSDLSYRLLLRDPARSGELLAEVGQLQGVSRLAGIKAEDETEA